MSFILDSIKDPEILSIAKKVLDSVRISSDECLTLYNKADLPLLSALANNVRERINGDNTYFNRNLHLEPTNICKFNCTFCSYRRSEGEEGSWDYTIEEMLDIVRKQKDSKITEIHIVGGVSLTKDVHYYGELIKQIKTIMPNIHIKAFTAIELEHMISLANLSMEEGLEILQSYGLGSIPGGGAEIFHEEIRSEICGNKLTGEQWLDIHRIAHKLGIHSNVTMLYGHMEKPVHIIDHLDKIRKLQDETSGFNTFIPLKFKNQNNRLSHLRESTIIEDMKIFAISRIFLDNISHLKAYWPMLGKPTAQLALSYGADDFDGTINDSTKIYSMAGSEEESPSMDIDEVIFLIKNAGRIPVERDTLFNIIKEY